MKKLILFLFVLVGFSGLAQHPITPTTPTTANNVSVVAMPPITGTVTATPTGTQAVSGTVTATPTGTQAVSGTVSITNATLTASPSSVTTSGTITAGAKAILLETSSDFVGTINGLLFQANGFLSYPVSPGTSWPAIPYTVSAGTLYIRKFN